MQRLLSTSASVLSALIWLSSIFIQDILAQTPSSFDPFSTSSRCPRSCNDDLTRWSQYPSINKLYNCNETLLVQTNLYNLASELPVRACVVTKSSTPPSASRALLRLRQLFSYTSDSGRTTFDENKQIKDMQLYKWAGESLDSSLVSQVVTVAANHLQSQSDKQGPLVVFVKNGNILVGVYVGFQVKKSSAADIVRRFAKWESKNAAQKAGQICSDDSLTTQILGIFVDTTGDVTSAQKALKSWNDAECIGSNKQPAEVWSGVSVSMIPGTGIAVGPDGNSSSEGITTQATVCRYTQVQAGDGCWALADRCKITQTQLQEYNEEGLCNNLQEGQYVCCSEGTLPDFSPQPGADGSCKVHTIESGEYCSIIASSNSMTVDMINERNKNTWGWAGCNYLIPGAKICLSTGTPPMPASVDNAVCGPQVPGTEKPDDMDDLADLNPCPIKACCNVWGQCGITEEFCISNPADTGAPGSSQPGANSCIANCGMEIVNNDNPPQSFMKVGYFEAWNLNRPCLHMRPRQINTNKYTHVHFAFGNITTDFNVDVSGLQSVYDSFKDLSGVKRILSFGGWSFSTDQDTAPIFRKGVSAEQRQTFANNVVSFIKSEDLDGVDFDWEYPAAPDIPGIPAGDPDDGERYLAFLKLVRDAMPDGKTIGIAAPASYWYLKGFPIGDIGEVVDYIIYMTYDLHGQWDYDNEWATPGCSAGNCLRTHVNTTETYSSLAMITKAGVPSNKVIVGMPLYGRSFKMTTEGCWGPDCTFTGPESGATPGKCTETSGYISNFELRDIMATKDVELYESEDGNGDIMVYDGVQWVSWMSQAMYQNRTSWITGLNFGGTSDWAIDLDVDYGDNDDAGGGDSGSGAVTISPDIYDDEDPTIYCYPPCTIVLPPLLLSNPTTISHEPETVTFEENWETTVTISGNIVTTSALSITSTVITVPPVTTTEIELWNVVWTDDDDDDNDEAVVWLTSSVTFPPITLTQTRTNTNDNRPPVTWTFSPRPYPTPDPDDDDPEDPDPPPPPPPTQYPSKIKVSEGAPKPTCKAGDHCGHLCIVNCSPGSTGCIGICGCIGPFCPHGNCVGAACNGRGGGGGGGGGGDDPDECRKRSTVSDCRVECYVQELPTTTTTSCMDPKCSNTVYGCSVTGTTKSTTSTASCPAYATMSQWDADEQLPLLGSGGAGGTVYQEGDYPIPTYDPGNDDDDEDDDNNTSETTSSTTTKPTADPTSPSDPSYPTLVPGETGAPYCFRNHNEDNRWDSFTADEADLVGMSVCSTADELSPDNTYGYASKGPSGILASVLWAKNQEGCNDKSAMPLGNFCLDAFQWIGMHCDDFDEDESYGGGYIEDLGYGCVRWFIGVDTATNAMKMAANESRVNAVDEDEHIWTSTAIPLTTGVPRSILFVDEARASPTSIQ